MMIKLLIGLLSVVVVSTEIWWDKLASRCKVCPIENVFLINLMMIISGMFFCASCGTNDAKYSKNSFDILKSDSMIVSNRFYSKDSTNLVVKYCVDQGAYGLKCNLYSVIKNDTKKPLKSNLSEGLLQFLGDSIVWKENVLYLYEDYLPFVRSGMIKEELDTVINGVVVKYLDSNEYMNPPQIEKDLSYEGNNVKLVKYRYHGDPFIHYSVIPVNGDLPKYGNVLIADSLYEKCIISYYWKEDKLCFILQGGSKCFNRKDYYFNTKREDLILKAVDS